MILEKNRFWCNSTLLIQYEASILVTTGNQKWIKQKIITEEVSRGKLGGNAESVVLKGSSTNNRVTFTIRAT